MDHKQVASSLRSSLKQASVKASVSMLKSCGSNSVRVCVPSYDSRFTPEQIDVITSAALSLGLTCVQGLKIDPSLERQLINKLQWEFYL